MRQHRCNQLATLSAPESRLLVIQPFDRAAMTEIEKAILKSDLGLTPNNDGKVIRIPIPALTEERRKDLVKHVKKIAEEFRVSVRNHRRVAIEHLKEAEKKKEITADEAKHGLDRVQKITDDFIGRIDKIVKAKEDEVMVDLTRHRILPCLPCGRFNVILSTDTLPMYRCTLI